MLLTYWGHSCVQLSDGKFNVVVDPFISGNPLSPIKSSELPKLDYILVTHGHADHYGETVGLARRDKATVICSWELKRYFEGKGLTVHPMSSGGAHDFPFGRVKATLAFHGCGGDPDADGEVPPPNTPLGFLITMGRKTVYHAGDTALYGDMKLLGERHQIHCACLPIGDNFTMGMDDAAYAASLLRCDVCVPIHYNTWPVIEADTKTFQFKIEKYGRKAVALKPGEGVEL